LYIAKNNLIILHYEKIIINIQLSSF